MPATSAPSPVPRILELGIYALVAVGAVLPALGSGSRVVGDGADLYGTLWFYWWIQDCLLNLRNPGFTDLFFHPLGKDIFAHTGNNFLDAALSVPFQLVLGYPRYQPVFVALILLGNALAFRPLAARILGDPDPQVPWHRRALGSGRATAAALLATGLWQACSFALFELDCGRLTQAFLWFLPLAVDRFLALGTPEGRARDGVLAGLFVGLQALTYWFMGHFTALLLGWLALLALVRPSVPRLVLVRRILLASAVALLAVSPFVVAMARHAAQGQVPGLSTASEGGLLAPLPTLGNNVAPTLHGYWLMERWGAPMLGHATWLGGAVLALVLGRQRLRWIGGALLVLVFALGPSVPLGDGEPVRWVPYLLAYHLVPFLDRLWFPYRMVVMAHLALALAIGTVAARLAGTRARRAVLPGVLAVLGLNLVEQHRWVMWPLVTRDVTPPALFQHVARVGGGVVHAPIGINHSAIVWQTVHQQPMFGGMGENAPLLWPEGYRDRLRLGAIRFLIGAVRHPDRDLPLPSPADLARLREDGFRWVVLHRDLVLAEVRRAHQGMVPEDELDRPVRVVHRISAGLGLPVAAEGPLVAWDLAGGEPLPTALAPTPERLAETSWAVTDQPAYEAALQAAGRLPGGPAGREHRPGGP